MADEPDPQNAASFAADRFPFVMLLTTTFLLGGMFLAINVPLILLAFGIASPDSPCEYQNIAKILSCGVGHLWKGVLKPGEGLSVGFLFLVLSLLVGFLLTPFDRLSTQILANAWGLVRKTTCRSNGTYMQPFTSAVLTASDYPAFLDGLMRNRAAKLHWEWELFHHYVYWGLVTNALIFLIFIIVLEWPQVSFLEAILFAAAFMYFLGFAALHSELMMRVHIHHKTHLAAEIAAAQQTVPGDAPASPERP